ncbi:DUF4388 domain-containing protein [Rhabdothermincola salaria]|uniref:DUF4388 domain-containing protein n=1 Tax=Rhabdothermincola salaria TaxID=2903142 RepID=UPI001E654125|nr:DUF4388 domain-containing protein [Rhabdothermincola salaria]
MALQGTIDTFALADVLRLLASTSKTGRLSLDGDRGRGHLEVVDGQVHRVGLDRTAPGGDLPLDESLFELLRFDQGAFEFEADAGVDPDGERHDLEALLGRAEELLAEWRRIASVLPSPQCRLTLAPELPGEEVAIDADRWRVLAVIGSGATAAAVAERIGASELGTGRLVHGLVEIGVVHVGEEAPAEEAQPPTADADLLPSGGGIATEAADHDGSLRVDHLDDVSTGGAEPPASWFEESSWDPTPAMSESPATGGDAFDRSADDGADDDTAAEFARHLANLSPKAAKAVAAAARADSPEERDRVLAEVEATEELDHELLLRFLGDGER